MGWRGRGDRRGGREEIPKNLCDANTLASRRVLEDGQRLMQALKPEVSRADALHIVGRKARGANLGLEFSQLMVQGAKPRFIQMLEEQRRHEHKPVGDVACHGGEAFPL